MLLPGAAVVRNTAEVLAIAEQSADDVTIFGALIIRGMALIHRDGADRQAGFEFLARMRERALSDGFSLLALPIADIHVAQEKTRTGDLDGAIAQVREVLDGLYDSGGSIWCALATTVLVEALIQRGGEEDLREAEAAIERLAAWPTDPGLVLHEITLLRVRALLARSRGDAIAYRDYRDRYRAMATSLGFEGHMKWAEEMD